MTRVWYWRTQRNPEFPFGTRPRRIPHRLADRFGEPVRELCRGSNGNALFEFNDGLRVVAPWRAARTLPEDGPQSDSPARRGASRLDGTDHRTREPGAVLETPQSALGWELRGDLASQRLIRLVLSDRCDAVLPNADGIRVVAGRVSSVSPTNAFVIVSDVHVPIDEIVARVRPHHSQARASALVYDVEGAG